MAKTHTLSEVSNQENAASLIKKPETIVGAIVLVVVLALASQSWSNANISQTLNSVSDSSKATVVPVTPEPSENTIPTEEPLAAIEVLADTASSYSIVARNGDTFWKIAKRECGAGVQGYRIREENNYQYRTLQPGDSIVITCE